MKKKKTFIISVIILFVLLVACVGLYIMRLNVIATEEDVSDRNLDKFEKHFNLKFPEQTMVVKATSINKDEDICLQVEMPYIQSKKFRTSVSQNKRFSLIDREFTKDCINWSYLKDWKINLGQINEAFAESESRTIRTDTGDVGIMQYNLIIFYKVKDDKVEIFLYR